MDTTNLEFYTDGIGKIHYFGNMIKMDLFTFEPSDDADGKGKPNPVITKRLVMSPNAFLASYESIMNMIKKLQDAGIIEAKPAETTETTEAQAVAETTPSTEDVSNISDVK